MIVICTEKDVGISRSGLTFGRMYEVVRDSSETSITTHLIKNNFGVLTWYPKKLFMYIEDYRDEKINEILCDQY